MINEHKGNIFNVTDGIIVHGCNCLGKMGSGIALQVKNRYRGAYDAYRAQFTNFGLYLGDIIVVAGKDLDTNEVAFRSNDYYPDVNMPDGLIVVNAMTQYATAKDDTEVVVDTDAVFAAFARIRLLAKATKKAVHFPQIGCGKANGKWEDIGPIIDWALGPDVEKHLWIYTDEQGEAELETVSLLLPEGFKK